jgi:hypothetical protein
VLHAGPWQKPLAEFVEATALSYCTERFGEVGDAVTVAPSWPPSQFSSGEQMLWRLLDDLARHNGIGAVLNTCDDDTIAAVLTALAAVVQSTRPGAGVA